MGLISSGRTDIGRKRKSNQDAIYVNQDKHIFIIADGMGGHNGGDIASAMAIDEMSRHLLAHYQGDPHGIQKEAIEVANKAIKARADKEAKLAGMGTTVLGQLFRGPHLYAVNVGDGRLYLIHKKKFFQLSYDHTFVQQKIYLGLLSRDQAAQDAHKNVLLRAVGFEENVDIDSYSYRIHRNDIFLSCSDGLHGKVSASDLLHIVNTRIPTPGEATQEQVDGAVDEMIALANANGGNDNISAIIVVAT